MKSLLMISVADYRYEHALCVADTAKEIAERFDINPQKAFIAGLLHDCAKGFTDDPEVPLALAAEAGIIPDELQLADPVLFLHAPLSAYIAKRDYEIEDNEILNAIERHISGHENMTNLDKVIYISDWTEPNRKGMEKYRELIKSDLDEAFFQLYSDNIIRIAQNGWYFAANTSDIYNFLLTERRRKRDGL